MGEKRGLWTVTEVFIKFLAEEAASSQLVVVCTVDLVSIYVEFLPDTGWTEEEITFSDESGDESTITSVSEKKPNYRVIRLEKNTNCLEVIESVLSILKYFILVSLLLDYSGTCSEKTTFNFRFKRKF